MASKLTAGVLVEREGSRLTVTLDNPAVHNRLAGEDIACLREIFAGVNDDVDIRVLVLTGSGKSFCAGFDLGELVGLAADARLPDFDKLSDELEHLRCPTICALNGGVYGGAIDLALACDFRIGVTGCQLLMPAARIGLHYYPKGIRRYVSRLGMAVSKRLLLFAESFKGEALLEIGFLDEIHSAENFSDRVNELAAAIQGHAPLAVEGMKHAINLYANAHVDDAAVQASFQKALASPDFKAGGQSIRSKTPPGFKRS